MERVPEPQLMTGSQQAEAYALADFEESHSMWLALFRDKFGSLPLGGHALDLGCGPGDISFRLAQAFPRLTVQGIDGSRAMLDCAKLLRPKYPGVDDRVVLSQGLIPHCKLPRDQYQLVVSNSLLHHLLDPLDLWRSIVRWAAPGAPCFVMDLMRPDSQEHAASMVDSYCAGEPEVLRRDFHHSLLAAYRVEEIERQLETMKLNWLTVAPVSDRHLIVFGEVPRVSGASGELRK